MAGTRYALLIAVETYANKKISQVRYAESDAIGMSTALSLHNFDARNQTSILSSAATYATVKTAITRHLALLREDDILFIFYAGHGFASGNNNFITCFDTDTAAQVGTSISLQWITEEMRKARGQHVVMFLDSCHSGIPVDESMRDFYSDLSEAELMDFFAASESRLCFTACKSNEVSRSHDLLKHGIWTYHLITALSGDAPSAVMGKTTHITVGSLQDYLSVEMERSLRKLFSTPVVQTPWLFGGMTRTAEIVDIGPLLAAKRAASAVNLRQLKKALFQCETLGSVKSLSGFQKNHKLPLCKNSTTDGFIANIATADLKSDIENTIRALRSHLGYLRKDVSHGVEEGGGTIITPDFDYRVSVSLDAENPSQVIWIREIDNFKDPSIVENDQFNEVFEGKFDTLTLQFDNSINVREFIEKMEDQLQEEITIDYDIADSYCDLTIPTTDYVLRVTSTAVQFILHTKLAPKSLLDRLTSLPKLPAANPVVASLPWGR